MCEEPISAGARVLLLSAAVALLNDGAGVAPWTSFVPFNYLKVEIVIHGKGQGNRPQHAPPSLRPTDVQKTDATP